jgi:ubiquinone biosynthesis protein COQ9
MFDQSTLEGKVIIAAMDLAQSPGWGEVSLRDIADASGCSLAEVMGRFETKQDVVAAFNDEIDRAMLEGAGNVEREQSPRDALFEVIMSRFDLMMPYKAALKAIAKEARRELVLPDLGRLGAQMKTQNRILQAAGVDHEGAALALRQLGLAALTNQVFLIWLDDDDPGMARTMAALDRRLRQGERTMTFLDDVAQSAMRTCGQVGSMAGRFADVLRGQRARQGAGHGHDAAAVATPTPGPSPDGNGAAAQT